MNRHNLVLNRLYEDLRKERSLVNNTELGKVYKTVLELYKKSMDEYKLYDKRVLDSMIRSVEIRNRFIHFSFMKPDVYTEELCKIFYTLFREVDKEIRNFKKGLK
jgi:predicted RNA-binding protein